MDLAILPSDAPLDGARIEEIAEDCEDLVEELGNIRPAKHSRTSRLANFIFRRDTPALTPEAFRTATRAHTSRFFKGALSHHGGHAQQGQGHGGKAMEDLLLAVRPGKGGAGDAFERTKAFAGKRQEDVAVLLGNGGDAFRVELHKALVKSGMGATRANKSVEVIYTALVAQFATGNEAERLAHYGGKLDSLQAGGLTPGARLQGLKLLDEGLQADTRLSNAGKARIAAGLAEARGLLEQPAELHEKLIAAAMRNITVDTSATELDGRLRELDERLLAINGSANLDEVSRQRLTTTLGDSRALLTTLKARPADLDALAGHGHLQGALRSLDTAAYVKARQSLAHAVDNVAPAFRGALLDQLNSIITGPRECRWLDDMQAGDVDIIDMVLPGAEWDEQAYALKGCAHKPATKLAPVNLEVQHERRKVARELDAAMQSAAFKSSVSKSLGAKGKSEHERLPANAFQALKADASLIAWFVKNAPNTLGQRDLAIGNWIKLSLHDPKTGEQDTAARDALFTDLRKRGIDTQQMELHAAQGAAQGFTSSADVLACTNQIRAFSQALQKSSTAAAVDPAVRAAEVGMQLLRGLGIRAASIDDSAIDMQTRQLIQRASQQKSGTQTLFQSLRQVAVLQVALKSGDEAFTPAGRGPHGTYSNMILNRLADMGMNLQSPDAVMQATTKQLLKELPRDTRNLEALCRDFDPTSASNRISSGLKSAFRSKPAAQSGAHAGGIPAAAAVGGVQQRREANEATLKRALAGLKPNQAITISFGKAGDMSVSIPFLPGVSAGADMRAELRNSIRVTCTESAAFSVELLSGSSMQMGGSLTTLLDTLDVRFGMTHAGDKGHRFTFDRQSDCEALLVAVARGGDVSTPLRAARSVEAADHAARRADVSLTATADFTIAALSATVAAGAGEVHGIHESGQFTREVFSRNVRAEAVVRAAVAGDLASAERGVGVDLGVRRTIARQNGMLAGGPAGSVNAGLQPSLSMVARVSHGNVQRCLATLLPDVSAQQRASIEAQLGAPEDGAELFTRYRLTEQARVQANMSLGRANSLLRDAARAPEASRDALRKEAMACVKQADAVTRSSANYTPEGFGWTVRSASEVSKSRGAFNEFAQREGEQTRFIAFDAPPAGQVAVGRSLLLSVMA